uniref:HMG box domain containing 3 n=3 Tax=Nothobranchius kadleci TaxID=1051664 RepID=A0A1A8CZG4_NOTKA
MDSEEIFKVVKVSEEVESVCTQTATSLKKKRSKCQENHPEKPKKPRSAYLLYYFDVHQTMQTATPNMPQSEVNKRISESWRRLSVAEKRHYLERAKLEKEGMETSSLGSSKQLTGFRKILPRANCFLLPKGSFLSHHPGGFRPEVNISPLDSSLEGGLHSVSLPLETQLTPVGLAADAELPERHVVADVEEVEATPSVYLQRISAPCLSQTTACSNSCVSQGAADVTENGVALKSSLTRAPSSSFNGAMVRQTTQVVTILPTQNLLKAQSVAAVGSLHPVMMISLGAKTQQATYPSYKMSLNTYTRRGHGRCHHPGCSFSYITRHKPSTCPECGSHLGGKWVPAEKQTSASKSLSGTTAKEENESCEVTSPPAERRRADVSKTNTDRSKKEGRNEQSNKRPAAPAETPLGGSSTTPRSQTKRVKNKPKVARIQKSKRTMRPILPALYNTGGAFIQILTVPPYKGKVPGVVSNKYSTVPQESFSGLKPSTLKQLGQTVTTATTIQDTPAPAARYEHVSSVTDERVSVVTVGPHKQQTTPSFHQDLGLSTGRGRGHCKNPSCDYIYKNRHKPAVCPKCGSDLTQKNTKPAKSETLLDPHQELSPAQRDIQRQSTVQLLRSTLQYPESEADLEETLTFIQELNSFKLIMVQTGNEEQETDAKTEALVESGWPRSYESAATHCGLCNHPLFKGERGTVAGQEDVWLLTETLMQTATLQLKTCLNVQCLALHSFTDLHPGLFNIGNKLLVSIDLFLKVRANIKLGQSPSHAVSTVLHHIPSHPVHTLSPEESSQVQELLLTGYWAFESVTVRDYNDMICGFCGIAPKLEIAQRCTNNVLELKNVEFTWPESSISDEVHVDDFWVTMETEAIEQAAFPADIPITRVDASIIAPFAPPLMRSPTVINTEKDKVLPQIKEPSGDPSVLVRLIHDGLLRLDKLEENNEEELRTVLTRCGVNIPPDSSKNELLASLLHLYTHTYSGLPTAPQPPEHLTAGKLSKVCPHQVVCSSKYLVRGETARDHVDLLLSSRYWPPVYVSDCPRQVALCVDLQYPELAIQMWGRNQGCFSDPFEEPGFVLCSELQDQPYSADLSLVAENQQIHPVTKSLSCWLVHPPGVSPGPPASEHHSMALCSDLEPYCALAAELLSEKEEEDRTEGRLKEQTDAPENDFKDKPEDCSSKGQPIIFTNAAYYYLHNRLVDFLTSRELVNQQISQVVKTCQPGEVVIRDALYRLGVAHINTE